MRSLTPPVLSKPRQHNDAGGSGLAALKRLRRLIRGELDGAIEIGERAIKPAPVAKGNSPISIGNGLLPGIELTALDQIGAGLMAQSGGPLAQVLKSSSARAASAPRTSRATARTMRDMWCPSSARLVSLAEPSDGHHAE